MEREHVGLVRGTSHGIHLDGRAFPVGTAPFEGPARAGAVDENPPHGLGRQDVKVLAIVQVEGLIRADKLQIGVMHEHRGLNGNPALLVGEFLLGHLVEFLVDEIEQLGRGFGVAGLRPAEEHGDFGGSFTHEHDFQ